MIRRSRAALAAGALVLTCALSGCTFGLGERETFVTRNLTVTTTAPDGAVTTIEGGDAEVVALEENLARGVVIFFDADDDDARFGGELQLDGDLAALCEGASVRLSGEGGRLEAVSVTGAPAPMSGALSAMRAQMIANTDDAQLQPTTLTMSAHPSGEGFSQLRIESAATVEGETYAISARFEVARVLEDEATPGWEGDRWEGQPITSFD